MIEAVGQALIWLAVRPEMALAGAALTGFGFSLVYPGFGVEAVRRVPAQSRGLAMGAYTAFLDLAQGLASPALGLIATGARLNVLFLVSARHRALRRVRRVVADGAPGSRGRRPAMRTLAATLFSFCLIVGGSAAAAQTTIEGANAMSKSEDVRAVAPALEKYAQEVVLGDLWKRPGLSPRDRSIVTVAALIARDQTVELPYYLGLALDNGVKPAEISEIITHLAFYTGWANAMDAIPAARDVFKSRNIGADQLPPASGPQLPLDEAAEKQRATRVGEQFGQITPSLVQYTTDVLFRDLWLRPALAPRDRSLVTVSALIATGTGRADHLPPEPGDG